MNEITARREFEKKFEKKEAKNFSSTKKKKTLSQSLCCEFKLDLSFKSSVKSPIPSPFDDDSVEVEVEVVVIFFCCCDC